MNCICIPAAWNDIHVTANKSANQPNEAISSFVLGYRDTVLVLVEHFLSMHK